VHARGADAGMALNAMENSEDLSDTSGLSSVAHQN